MRRMSATRSQFSQDDEIFATLVAGLPPQLYSAMKESRLTSAGTLRSSPRTPFRKVGLAEVVGYSNSRLQDSDETISMDSLGEPPVSVVDSALGCSVALSSPVLFRFPLVTRIRLTP